MSRAQYATVLVTGASAGLGAAVSNCLAERGWRVYAGSRRASTQADAMPSISPLRLDVTNPSECADAVSSVVNETGSLDAIVCNAGVNVSAPAEELSATRAQAILDTNFWGVVHSIRAVLPHFRQRRAGTIVVVGSLAGIVSPPGEAYYAASKHAVRGFLESLQYEVSGFGIRVHLVEPGFIRTDLATASAPADSSIPDYDTLREKLDVHWRAAIAGGISAEIAAAGIAGVVCDPDAPFRTQIGRDATWVPRWKALFPASLFFAIARRRFGIAGVAGNGDSN